MSPLLANGEESLLYFALERESPNLGNVVAVIAIGLVVLAYFAFFIGALVSVLRSDQSGGMKLVWVIFAFCAPFLGPLLWFTIGRRHAQP